jgi:hypothetical protein
MPGTHSDVLDQLLRPVLSSLPGSATLLRETVTASPGVGRHQPCGRLATHSRTLDRSRTHTLAEVTRLPGGLRPDTIKVVQGATGVQRQMLAVARVAASGGSSVPDRSVRSSRTVVQLAEHVVTRGLLRRPAARSARRVHSVDDPADPHGQRRRLIRLPDHARGSAEARLEDARTALADLASELDVMMGHLIIPVQWRFRPAAPAPREAAAAGGEWPPAMTAPSWGRRYDQPL